MILTARNHLGIPLLVSFFLITALPATSRADNLIRLYPEASLSGFYSDNLLLQSVNGVGDFGSTLAVGFYLDYTSNTRFVSLHYDTFAQLFAHESRYDRVGEGQFISASDYEHLSATTGLRLLELFYRDSPTAVATITGEQAPQFNTVAATVLLANHQASINQFHAELTHHWQSNWSTVFTIHQTTYWSNASNKSSNSAFDQGIATYSEYHLNDRLSLGPGYRFYDYRFTAPGQPDEQAHWPFARIAWTPMENLELSGIVGVVFFKTQGNSSPEIYPGGLGKLEYDIQRGRLTIYGGQEPQLTASFGTAGQLRNVRGIFEYQFTKQLTGYAGGGFYESNGTGFNGQLISLGVGLTQRVNQSLSVYAKFIQLRRNESGQSQFLPNGLQSGQEAVGNYIVVGLSIWMEAHRWSWQ